MASHLQRKLLPVVAALFWISLAGCPRAAVEDPGTTTAGTQQVNNNDGKQPPPTDTGTGKNSGTGKDNDPSVEISEDFPTIGGHKTENGRAFDKAVLDLGDHKKLVLPDNATVTTHKEPGKVFLQMTKWLHFKGHPGGPMSILEARKHMGVAMKHEGDALVLATFGEWDTMIEGGATLKLTASVPEGVEVTRNFLYGDKCLRLPGRGYGYVRPGPADEGWTVVPSQPDSRR